MAENQSWPIEPAHTICHRGFTRRQRTVKHLPFQKNGELAGGAFGLLPPFFLYRQRNFRWWGSPRPGAPPCIGPPKWEGELIFQVQKPDTSTLEVGWPVEEKAAVVTRPRLGL